MRMIGILTLVFLIGVIQAMGADILVTNTSDAGPGSLSQAINDSNNSIGTQDTIKFNIDAGTDAGCNPTTEVCTIKPLSPLPVITDPVIINGYTQPGAMENWFQVGNNAVLKIELDGSEAGFAAEGLAITAGNSTVRGLIINRFSGNAWVLPY